MWHTKPHRRYRRICQPPELPHRSWPDRALDRAPRWLSTDLRDGNQALEVPMNPKRKLAMFDLLVAMGYKEIEVGFPAASRDDHDFVRMLIETDRIPDDVVISVLTQAREELIEQTTRSLAGARHATVHLYNATSPLFRDLVFGMSAAEVRALAADSTRMVMKYAERDLAGCVVGYQYSPELFNETEPEFALEVCEAVMDVWEPGPGREIILNFPTTVERSTPNVFADQIEWLDRRLSRREHVCLSVHTHNDRGSGVAAAELAVLAGAQRIEGCLFGGGERAGNVCLVTLGLNLLSEGIDPGIDFSDLERVRRTVEYCTGLDVPKRHPYGGELVFTAFSGSHQDAINKGFTALRHEVERTGAAAADLPWQVPYLPLDPRDVGRSYEALVRINSQSGKGGVAYVMSAWHGLHLPRDLQVEFARVVQALTDVTEAEVGPARLLQCFEREYVLPAHATTITPEEGRVSAELHVEGLYGGSAFDAGGLDTLSASLAPWGVDVVGTHLIDEREDGFDAADPSVVVYASCVFGERPAWGVGIDRDPQAAAFRAVCAAAGRIGAGITLPLLAADRVLVGALSGHWGDAR